ncbi:MAG: cupin domain-containing protein [Rhodomicrobium sp.]
MVSRQENSSETSDRGTAKPAKAGSFGNPDEPAQGAINARNPRSVTVPGPQNSALSSQFPSAKSPPATDIGDLPMFWASFNNAPRRIQDGGWARQVTQSDFAISETISAVNMRLTAGGIRELHWHLAAEWAYMTYGACRVTTVDDCGRSYIADVREGDLWYFPPGQPHSLQGLGPDGCEFVICFDEGKASEYNTLLLTDWLAHTPPETLAENFGVSVEMLSTIPIHDLWIFQGKLPGPLAGDRAEVNGARAAPPHPFTFSLASMPPLRETKGGSIRVAGSGNFKASQTIAAGLLTIRPGAMREMHWHPNADEWQYWIKGTGSMTVFNTGPKAVTMDFNPGDIGYVKRGLGHYIKNTGDSDLQLLAVFKSSHYAEISLTGWLTHTPKSLVAQHLNLDEATIKQFPSSIPKLMPE